MLTLFPLQATWAAVGVYCQHESGVAAKHFGHHAHQHKADDSKSDKGSLPKIDADCTFCYAGGVANLTSSFGIPLDTLNLVPPPVDPNAVFSFLHERPERPKWASAV